MKYKGAAIQYDCHFMDKEKNLAALTNLVLSGSQLKGRSSLSCQKCAPLDTILKVWNKRPRWQSQ